VAECMNNLSIISVKNGDTCTRAAEKWWLKDVEFVRCACSLNTA